MINPILKDRFPFAYNYFSQALILSKENKKAFPQALILEGEDTIGQYLFTLELARNLNCKDDNENCTNCKWIKTYSHPAINNVSQIHFKSEDDESKTVISVKQAFNIEKSLNVSSDYHRFFIFFSSSNKELSQNNKKEFENLGYSSEINYSIEPLNQKTFHIKTPNILLKSIEEPPKNTTFVFLTNSKENILPTIVSRCLVFKLSGNRKIINYSNIQNILSIYPNISYQNAFDISEEFNKIITDEQIDLEYLLNEFLEYLKDSIKQNLANEIYVSKARKDIDFINDAIKMYRANVQNKIVLDTLFLKIARGY